MNPNYVYDENSNSISKLTVVFDYRELEVTNRCLYISAEIAATEIVTL